MNYDLRNFKVEKVLNPDGSPAYATVSLPLIRITGTIFVSGSTDVVADLSEPSAGVLIPDALQALTPDQFLAIIQPSAADFLLLKAGLD